MHGIAEPRCLTGDDVTAGDEPEAQARLRPRQPAAASRWPARWPRAATCPGGRIEPAPRLFRRRRREPRRAAGRVPRPARALKKALRRRALPAAADRLPARAARAVRARGRGDRAHRSGGADPVDHDPAHGGRAALRRREGPGHRGPAADRRARRGGRRPAGGVLRDRLRAGRRTRSRCPASPACTSSRSARTRASPSSAHSSASSRASKGRSRSRMDTTLSLTV